MTREPSIIWLEFLNTFSSKYPIFIVTDIQADYSQFIAKYPDLNFIQISDEECMVSGYFNSDYVFKPVVATDRAFYYFNRVNTQFSNIWFCEDDVFFKNIDPLINLDSKYPNADLISPTMKINVDGRDDGWPHWGEVKDTLKLPWANGVLCCFRASQQMMEKIDDFVITHKKLNYKEFLFHTVAIHNNMEIRQPVELETIQLAKLDNNVELQKTYAPLYHPIKDFNDHSILRNK